LPVLSPAALPALSLAVSRDESTALFQSKAVFWHLKAVIWGHSKTHPGFHRHHGPARHHHRGLGHQQNLRVATTA